MNQSESGAILKGTIKKGLSQKRYLSWHLNNTKSPGLGRSRDKVL